MDEFRLIGKVWNRGIGGTNNEVIWVIEGGETDSENCNAALAVSDSKISSPNCQNIFVPGVSSINRKVLMRASQCNMNGEIVASGCRDIVWGTLKCSSFEVQHLAQQTAHQYGTTDPFWVYLDLFERPGARLLTKKAMERIHSVVAGNWAVGHCIEALPRPGNKIALPDCNKIFDLGVIGIIGKLLVRASQCNKNEGIVAGRCRDMSRKPSGSAIWRRISPTSESASVLHVCRLFKKPWVRATGYNNNGGNVATGCRLMGSGQYCWSTFKAWPGELLAKMELVIGFGWMPPCVTFVMVEPQDECSASNISLGILPHPLHGLTSFLLCREALNQAFPGNTLTSRRAPSMNLGEPFCPGWAVVDTCPMFHC